MIRFVHKKYISLNVKMVMAVITGMILAIIVYFSVSFLEEKIAYHFFTSDEAVERIVGGAYDRLEKYVDDNHVKGTDSKELSDWLKDQNYIYIKVYDNFKSVFEAGWWVDTGAGGNLTSDADRIQKQIGTNTDSSSALRIDKSKFKQDVKNRIVNFDDGQYYVYINSYGQERLYSILSMVKLVLSFMIFLLTIMVYHGAVLNRIGNLSKQVNNISGGDYESDIETLRNDELGKLAMSVNHMRKAILEHGNREQQAWNANFQLITAMSHDIRTPLTSLIGYLDIIEAGKYENPQDLRRYINVCRDKAFQLKELSDSLFRYFLVFGNNQNDRELELISGGILFQQVLGDHLAEVMSYGFLVDLDYRIPDEVNVWSDVTSLRRLFDNLFSNIMKYASKKKPISIKADVDQENIVIELFNYIYSDSRNVESNQIGVKTCERICQNLKGTFEITETEDTYKTHMTFPITKDKLEQSEEDELSEDGDTEEKSNEELSQQ